MSIRNKLFIFIPLLVIFLNFIFFLIFYSGKQVQESYHVVTERILLYKQITDGSKHNLRTLNQHLTSQDDKSLQAFQREKLSLKELRSQLADQENIGTSHTLMIQDLEHMIDSFVEEEEATISALQKGDLAQYTLHYAEAEKTSSFIREEGQNLVDAELSFYQPFYKNILRHTEVINRLGAALFIMTTVVSIGLAIWLSRSITNPINHLVQAARRISHGEVSPDMPKGNDRDEIGILALAFQHMLKSLKELNEKQLESVEKDRLVKELELKALQNQINPHFLFNTLNALSKLAFIEGAEKTSDLTISVSNLLRYNLQKLDQPVTLREEVENVSEYFAIQKARFRERITFQTVIEEEAMNHLVPCLTLQPIIENAFVHGIEGMEEGAVICLRIQKQEDTVKISIEDNGVGMSEETKQSLLRMEQGAVPSTSTGIGTVNVFKRLELFYETNNLVRIESKEGEGTLVMFHLPYTSMHEQ
ncbi:sensor histidine kinase [Priestia koreensis]|uniref:histidine kinase n=1 Tax=Priestia koreensis TaxID=284581 RepID=A0A0M0KQP5_9BACI|nr:histidine kinase [Priestia koreensis]KOO41166.1 hypothetical protein AMD01_19700 [Priestia koreensis]